ncbi:TetR/AcrR family transcriptional regulator [Planomonospora venezuelensis]|uniref:AcrR family transcriptional regulator n=1 Tax=Planomonospora venezuelensis TaxID=1999 RepID=A0A841D4F7_PLAVE|nr:TetR/AcrR family transcriptional regulator [Planomonospora venezuelensis]MBB5964359.1 AcrR family transcriptional regulator [Planomonospora venezuelensis]GIN05107.1 TetR family transcriptional regulator [Planomonospora venezuelensis]
MTSIRHNKAGATAGAAGDAPGGAGAPGGADVPSGTDAPSGTGGRHGEAILDAAREVVLAVGVRRTTLTDVARRAGVSRMTVYRHWPDVRSLVGDLMTREWVLVAGGFAAEDPVAAAVGVVRELRGHPLWRKIVEVDPELLLPYLLDRRGASHEVMLTLVEQAIARGQDRGAVRPGDTRAMARAVLLTAQSFLLSGPTMLGPVTEGELDAELAALLERYLSPSPPHAVRAEDSPSEEIR